MKFSASLAISGAAVASAAVFPREPAVDYCPVVVKTIGLSHIELSQFPPAMSWTPEEASACVEKSEYDPAQYWPNLNTTDGDDGSDDSGANEPSSYAASSYAAGVPYPTGHANLSLSIHFPAVPTGGLYSHSGSAAIPSYTDSAASASYTDSASTTGSGYRGGDKSSSSASGSASATLSQGATTSSAALSTSSSASASSSSSSAAASVALTIPTRRGCTNPSIRKEWRNLSATEKDNWISGFSCLMNTPSSNPGRFPGSRSLYEDLTSLHQQVAMDMHQSGRFLVFHRYYLHILETMLRKECAYKGPMVWWNEALDAGNFAKAPMMTAQYYGESRPAINGRGVCVTESGFDNYEPNVGPGRAVGNPHCLSRAIDENTTKLCGAAGRDRCAAAKNYNTFRECAEMTYHAYGHNGIGSVMSDVSTSPEEPLFYIHHGYVDNNYRMWQNAGKTRNNEMGGPMSASNSRQVTPNDILPGMGLVPDCKIADVMNTQGGYLCYKYDNE